MPLRGTLAIVHHNGSAAEYLVINSIGGEQIVVRGMDTMLKLDLLHKLNLLPIISSIKTEVESGCAGS